MKLHAEVADIVADASGQLPAARRQQRHVHRHQRRLPQLVCDHPHGGQNTSELRNALAHCIIHVMSRAHCDFRTFAVLTVLINRCVLRLKLLVMFCAELQRVFYNVCSLRYLTFPFARFLS